jgi:hypothetical protein
MYKGPFRRYTMSDKDKMKYCNTNFIFIRPKVNEVKRHGFNNHNDGSNRRDIKLGNNSRSV